MAFRRFSLLENPTLRAVLVRIPIFSSMALRYIVHARIQTHITNTLHSHTPQPHTHRQRQPCERTTPKQTASHAIHWHTAQRRTTSIPHSSSHNQQWSRQTQSVNTVCLMSHFRQDGNHSFPYKCCLPVNSHHIEKKKIHKKKNNKTHSAYDITK